jgi:hypothetical protein
VVAGGHLADERFEFWTDGHDSGGW